MRRNYVAFAVIACLSLLFVLTACKSDEEKLVGMFEEMADIVDSNKDDCDAMAEELGSWWDDNGEDMKEIMKSLKDKHEDGPPEEYAERIDKASEKMMGGIMGCADNEKVGEIFQKMGEAM